MGKNIIIIIAILSLSALVNVANSASDVPVSAEVKTIDNLPVLPKISRDKLGELLVYVDEQLNKIDRSQFDIDVLLEKLSYDDKEIIQFVLDNINFEDYTGVLRGAEGTLKSRAGNSIDQSLLLAKMLNDAGLEARIVEGLIPKTRLTKLLLNPRSPAPKIFIDDEPLKQSTKVDSTTNTRVDTSKNPIIKVPQEVLNTTEMILSTMRSNGVTLEADSEIEAQSDVPYFWVEYRDSPSSSWEAVHPIFANTDINTADIKPLKYFAKKIDEAFQQRISVQGFIERSWNGKLETLAVTEPYEYPASNLSGVTFSYSVIPNVDLAISGATSEEIDNLVISADSFYSMFDFGTPKAGLSFDTLGNVLSLEDASSEYAAIVKTVANRFGLTTSALIDSEATETNKTADPLQFITRHWLKIIITQPNREPKIIYRNIAKWQGDSDEFKRSLARIAYFRVETGQVSPALFLEKYLTSIKNMAEILLATEPVKGFSERQSRFSLDAELFLFLSDIAAGQDEKAIKYRAEPAIVARYFPFGRTDSQREGFDIVSAPRFSASHNNGQNLKSSTLKSGITDTWLEHMLFAEKPWQTRSAFGLLNERMALNKSLTMISDKNNSDIEEIPVISRELIQQDLNNKQMVLLAGEAKACDSWWRIDPNSGEALGILDNGWGGVAEYAKMLSTAYKNAKRSAGTAFCNELGLIAQASTAIGILGTIDEGLSFSGHDLCSLMITQEQTALCTIAVGVALATAATENLTPEMARMVCMAVIT
tara:strand:- start:8297 stop:10585 length:2289 start_codon:yes stop_codon:yes gene_type:complete